PHETIGRRVGALVRFGEGQVLGNTGAAQVDGAIDDQENRDPSEKPGQPPCPVLRGFRILWTTLVSGRGWRTPRSEGFALAQAAPGAGRGRPRPPLSERHRE